MWPPILGVLGPQIKQIIIQKVEILIDIKKF
jgi:hypothetical protein